jgi:uncharacterized membrane protein HdeD (DUF308 family)
MANRNTETFPEQDARVIALTPWGWFVGVGLVLAAIGVMATLNLMIATVVTSFYVGTMLLVGGGLLLVHGFHMHGRKRHAFWIISGGLYLAAGMAVLLEPFVVATILTLLLAVSLAVSGVMRATIALSFRHAGWGWTMASGTASIVASILILAGWPGDSVWLLGMLMAIDLLIQGITLSFVGWSIKVISAG